MTQMQDRAARQLAMLQTRNQHPTKNEKRTNTMTTFEDVLRPLGATAQQIRIHRQAVESATDALIRIERMASELRTAINQPNGEMALRYMRLTQGHAGYSNTMWTNATEAINQLAFAQGMVDAIVAGRSER